MQLRRTLFGLFVGILGVGGLLSACATSAELGNDDDENSPLEAGAGENDQPKKDSGPATPPKGSSSSSSSSSGGSSGGSSSGGSGSSSGGSSGWLEAPNAGEPCDVITREYVRSCGLCGKEKAVCGPGDGGAGVIFPYGPCEGEVEDGCYPDTEEGNIDCGYCGKQTRKCNNSCKWTTTTCSGQVTIQEKCMPGTTQMSNQFCTDKASLDTWTCNGPESPQRCQWSVPNNCVPVVYPSINAPTTLGGQTSASISVANQTLRSRPAACAANAALADRRGAVTEIRNTTGNAIKVDIWVSPKSTGYNDKVNDRQVHVYLNAPPATDDLLKACQTTNDTCGTDANKTWLNNADTCSKDVSIPAFGKIWVLSSSYYELDPGQTPSVIALGVRRVL